MLRKQYRRKPKRIQLSVVCSRLDTGLTLMREMMKAKLSDSFQSKNIPAVDHTVIVYLMNSEQFMN